MTTFLKKPTTDFAGVRDGRLSLPLWLDIDLTTPRSNSAGSSLIINIAGNSFYSDADTTNCGSAVVHFQDTTFGNTSAPFFVTPGFIANVPFTQISVENLAQPGKRLRIFYGVDIDFQAGVNSTVSINGAVALNGLRNNVQLGAAKDYTGSYQSSTAMAANTPDTIFAAGANANGAIILRAGIQTLSAAGNTSGGLVAKAGAPASIIDGDTLLITRGCFPVGGSFMATGGCDVPIYVPPGKGLYFITNNAEAAGYLFRHVQYYFL